MNQVEEAAYAKINLGLDVIRKREDGYHELRMIMQTIDLNDTIVLKKTEGEPKIRLFVEGRDDLEADERNLAYRAAAGILAYADENGIRGSHSVEIHLTKRIPMAAGLAGGSADCAAVLRGMNRLFEFGFTDEQLRAIGVQIGADVPYCVCGGTMLAEGIGEILTPLSPCPDCYCLIAKPPIDVSTAFVYGNLKAGELTTHPDIDGAIEAIREKNLTSLCGKLMNVLETVTIPTYPVIEEIKEMMRRCGAEGAMMSGSGPTVFGLFTSEEQLQDAANQIRTAGITNEIFACKPVNIITWEAI